MPRARDAFTHRGRAHRDAIDATSTSTRHATTQASKSTVPRTSAQKKRRPCKTGCPSRPKRAAATRSTPARACRCADPASHHIATKGRRASSAGGAMFTPARRNFGPRETRRFQSRPYQSENGVAERRGGTPQVLRETVRADAHRRVLRPAPGLRLDLRHLHKIL